MQKQLQFPAITLTESITQTRKKILKFSYIYKSFFVLFILTLVAVTSFAATPTVTSYTKNGFEDVVLSFTTTDFTSHYSDADNDPLAKIRITGFPATTSGVLQFNGVPVTNNQEINAADLALISWVAAPVNYNGNATASIAIAYRASDGTSYSTTDAIVRFNIAAVNDAPSFTMAGNQASLPASGAQSKTGFITSWQAGGGSDENSQSASYIVTNNNNALFTAGGQPAISPSGVLTYTPATSTTIGIATVTVVTKDNGGTANGGVDQSAAQTFTIKFVATCTPNSANAAGTGVITNSSGTGPATISYTTAYSGSAGLLNTSSPAQIASCGFSFPAYLAWTGNSAPTGSGVITFTFNTPITSVELTEFFQSIVSPGTPGPETAIFTTNAGLLPSLSITNEGTCPGQFTIAGNQLTGGVAVSEVQFKVNSSVPFTTLTITQFNTSNQNGGIAFGFCTAGVATCNAGNLAPIPTANTIAAGCTNATANLTTLQQGTAPTNAQYQWHTGTPGTNANIYSTPTAATVGTYYLVYYDVTNNCYSPTSTAVTVTAPIIPANPTATLATINNECPLTTVDLTTRQPAAVANETYEWWTGTANTRSVQIGTPSAHATAGTVYLWSKSAVSGCYSLQGSPVTITITGCVNAVLTKSLGSTSIASGATTTYTWTITNTSAGSYNLIGLGFTDALPSSIIIAAIPNIVTTGFTVTPGVTAPAGGSTVTVVNGGIAANSTATITVNITNKPGMLNATCPASDFTNGAGNVTGLSSNITNSIAGPCLIVTAACAASTGTLQ